MKEQQKWNETEENNVPFMAWCITAIKCDFFFNSFKDFVSKRLNILFKKQFMLVMGYLSG